MTTDLSIKSDWCPTCERGWSWADGNVHRIVSERDQQEEEIERLQADIVRLKAWAEYEQRGRHKAEEDRLAARTEVELWKNRWESERRDHEATMRQCDDVMNER